MKEKETIMKLMGGLTHEECMELVKSGSVEIESETGITPESGMIIDLRVRTRPTNCRIHRNDRHIFCVQDRPKPISFHFNAWNVNEPMTLTHYGVVM